MISSFFSLKYGEFGPSFSPKKNLFGQVSAPLFLSSTGKISSQIKILSLSGNHLWQDIEKKW
jgi:hypothetical protein